MSAVCVVAAAPRLVLGGWRGRAPARSPHRPRQCLSGLRASNMRPSAYFLLLATIARARELDPAACASRFDVQRDKIIRTEESRAMGARYLSELDVGARGECLRLCCETEACDVFVYEEKNSGSCYLFSCGPPEDFRCKFTVHGNFSSGVLALGRRRAELQDEETLARREQELANLRSVRSTTVSSTSAATTPAPRSPPPPPPPPPPHTTPPKPQTTSHRCSRYQFECHTGGECIAVYNACDGIPQCADGSDEAPELGCPSAPPLDLAPPPPATTTTKPPPPHTPPVKIYQESGDAGGNEGLVDSQVVSNERWPHRLTQAQPQHRFTDTGPSSHIFSHKGGLLQEPETNVMSGGMMGQYPGFESPWPRRTPWSQPIPGMENLGGVWGGVGGVGGVADAGYGRYEWPEPDPRRAWPVPQPRPQPEMQPYIPPKTMPETASMYSNQQQTLRDSPKKGFELVSKQPVSEPPPPPPPPPETRPLVPLKTTSVDNTTKKKDLNQPTTASQPAAAKAPAAAAAAAAAVHEHFTSMDEHDGLSERPPAAVMLLVLGVLMTAATGGMAACRVRAARRRRRRPALAHDPDYLVNGMYL